MNGHPALPASYYLRKENKVMRYLNFFLFVLIWPNSSAWSQGQQDLLSGDYYAVFNGDNMSLNVEHESGSSYKGLMKDSYQTYQLTLDLSGVAVSGVATESTLGLTFQVTGQVQTAQLALRFSIEVQGEQKSMDVAFNRSGSAPDKPSEHLPQILDEVIFPSGAAHPQELIGTWTKEELYQSGYGDSYMGAGSSQSMTLLEGGRMAEAGSSSYISGSNYNGQSSAGGGGVIPGIGWYTIGNQLYIQVNENGQTQSTHLGRYYVENNSMLITGTNGEKILLTKK